MSSFLRGVRLQRKQPVRVANRLERAVRVAMVDVRQLRRAVAAGAASPTMPASADIQVLADGDPAHAGKAAAAEHVTLL